MHDARDIEKGPTKCIKPCQTQFQRLKNTARTLRESKYGRAEKAARSSPVYALMIILATLFSVFGDDLRFAFLPSSIDVSFFVLMIACFCVFLVDIIISALFEPKYLRSAIFVLDFVATSSIIFLLVDKKASARSLVLARVARLVRIMRMMRVARFAMVSQEKALQGAEKRRTLARASISYTGRSVSQADLAIKRRESRARAMSRAAVKGVSALGSVSTTKLADIGAGSTRSRLGVKLMQLTTEKVILLVLLLVLGLQILSPTYEDQTAENNLRLLHSSFDTFSDLHCFNNVSVASRGSKYCISTPCCEEFDQLIAQFVENLHFQGARPNIRSLVLKDHSIFEFQSTDVRTEARTKISYRSSWVLIDTGSSLGETSKLSMLQTTVIMAILLIFPYAFGRDVLTLAVSPLETIFDRVQAISTDPFHAWTNTEGKKTRQSKELDLINESLQRLTKLLQVGLGHAGTDIITKNLRQGEFCALQSGLRTEAIFCFCNIRNFSDYCDVLQEDCITFVNLIAAVVAQAVRSSKGMVNKNIGEAFLLVWKWLLPGESEKDFASDNRSSTPEEAAEACLEASTTIIKRVARNQKIQAYAKNSAIWSNLGEDTRISVGIGLHVGWAIEGAVGSEQKIDATYLSPTVNTTARLESGTRQYGVSLLMSKQFFDLLNHSRDRCRRVDCVAVKGSLEPIELYTYVMSSDARELIKHSEAYYDMYIRGDWQLCKISLDQFLSQWPSDGPARAIWDLIERHEFQAPEDWEGYRKLTKK